MVHHFNTPEKSYHVFIDTVVYLNIV